MSAGRLRLDPAARVHLVGIGGAGMSALAWILLQRGHRVSGSDLRGGRTVAALATMGASVEVGHAAEQADGADLVVVSAAIPSDNPERMHAVARGIPVALRAELLELLLAGRRRLLVTGTHGKTTTTSMTTVALQAAGLDPSFAIGGTLHDSGTSAHHGSGRVFVAEADEAYRSFLHLTPDCAVVTNIDMDHHDTYADEADLHAAFATFVARRTDGAPLFACADDAGARRLADQTTAGVVRYGESADADLRIIDVVAGPTGSRFHVREGGEDLGEFLVRAPGRHNVRNAVAALGAARWAGAPVEAIRTALAGFAGAHRRFQELGAAGGVTVVDDYAHHPTELAATLEAAHQTTPSGRIVAVFQPHLYSRTAALGAQLGVALAAADVVVVTDIYGAREAPMPGVTSALVADAARAAGAATHVAAGAHEVVALLVDLVREGDLVLTLGAGDITEVGPVLLDRLQPRGGASP